MAEFCECGSIKIESNCSNKNCEHSQTTATKSRAKKSKIASKVKATETKKETAKPANTRRTSKCVTYDISELEKRKKESE